MHKLLSLVSSLSFLLACTAANYNCWSILHQPQQPDAVKALRKF